MNLILHHYDFSNFSEKVRVILGMKKLRWSSVEIPAYMPKPDYLPLTGGYRRTPALQIGADVYCDTRLIAEVLEELRPTPSLFPGGARYRASSFAMGEWAESRLIWPAALYITGIHAERYPQEFHSDRAVLHGKPEPDVARVKRSAMAYLAQLRSELARVEDFFADGSDYVLGESPGYADIAVYHVPWFLDTIDAKHGLLDAMPLTRAWMARIAEFGHGDRHATSSQEALAVAKSSRPIAIAKARQENTNPEGIALGEAVAVSPLGEFSPAYGNLVGVDDERISIEVRNEQVECIHVHFPRSAYKLSRKR